MEEQRIYQPGDFAIMHQFGLPQMAFRVYIRDIIETDKEGNPKLYLVDKMSYGVRVERIAKPEWLTVPWRPEGDIKFSYFFADFLDLLETPHETVEALYEKRGYKRTL